MSELPLWVQAVVEFLNAPVPIIGFSGLTAGMILYNILKLALPTNKQVVVLQSEVGVLKSANVGLQSQITTLQAENSELKSHIDTIAKASTNPRVKAIVSKPTITITPTQAVEVVEKVVKTLKKARG